MQDCMWGNQLGQWCERRDYDHGDTVVGIK